MNKTRDSVYPLDYSKIEIERLEQQAVQLEETTLSQYLAKASTCLEIGCGSGANLQIVAKSNPAILYTGIDYNGYALETARLKGHQLGIKAQFTEGDATKLPFGDRTFDFIFIKLVLWSVGAQWKRVIQEAYRVLKPGGSLYCFEPDDRLLVFHPQKPALQSLIQKWQEKQLAGGFNPFIGRELFQNLVQSGFENTYTQPYFKISLGVNPEKYVAHLKNLENIFLAKGPAALGLEATDPVWTNATKEIQTVESSDLILETHFIALGQKPGGKP